MAKKTMRMWLLHDRKAHIKAFTIQELLVAMVISSLIIGMVYAIYVQLNKQLYTYGRHQEEMVSFNQFKHVLATDLFLGLAIEKETENRLTIRFRQGEHGYLFLEDKVIRNREGALQDTFDLGISGFELKANESYMGIALTTKMDGEPITIYEAKEIPIADRINSMYTK
ncbi:PilW family protein [Flagellimonas onchidii]|uniref:PilW family protein n=1 Tax=Flagellimonas onchidii TaxID=2562684 RepID=UPI0010A66F62|nr:hypothetical protein [Allomuricauda onchidii]